MGKVSLISQRDMLLVPFPFSDQSGKKVRPVVVISNLEFNEHSEDYLVAGVTSNISREKYSIPLTPSDLEEGELFTKCSVKVENLLKIDRELIIKKIGRLSKQKFGDIVKTLNKIVSVDE